MLVGWIILVLKICVGYFKDVQLMYKVKHNLCLRTLFVTCFILIATLTVYGREIFIYLHLTLLRVENIQFDI